MSQRRVSTRVKGDQSTRGPTHTYDHMVADLNDEFPLAAAPSVTGTTTATTTTIATTISNQIHPNNNNGNAPIQPQIIKTTKAYYENNDVNNHMDDEGVPVHVVVVRLVLTAVIFMVLFWLVQAYVRPELNG